MNMSKMDKDKQMLRLYLLGWMKKHRCGYSNPTDVFILIPDVGAAAANKFDTPPPPINFDWRADC